LADVSPEGIKSEFNAECKLTKTCFVRRIAKFTMEVLERVSAVRLQFVRRLENQSFAHGGVVMCHSEDTVDVVMTTPQSPLDDRLVCCVKAFIDELFDRTVVALDALLKPLGVDSARAKFAPCFMAELAAVVQVAAWEDAGVRHLLPLDFPPAVEVMSDLVWRYHQNPLAFMDPDSGTVMFDQVVRTWVAHCHPDAREMLGCDVVITGQLAPVVLADAFVPVVFQLAAQTTTQEQTDVAQ
jgi:hypothetical protein